MGERNASDMGIARIIEMHGLGIRVGVGVRVGVRVRVGARVRVRAGVWVRFSGNRLDYRDAQPCILGLGLGLGLYTFEGVRVVYI